MKTEAKNYNVVKAIRLKLPHRLYQRVEQAARAAECDLSEMIVATLETRLPPLSDDLPPALASELSRWAVLDDAAIRAIANAFLSPQQQRRFTALLRKSEAGTLSAREQSECMVLQQEYLRVSQNKAKALYLLAQRETVRQQIGAMV